MEAEPHQSPPNSGPIDFAHIKPHRGDRRWAFEELCFHLFTEELKAKGEATRREGSGGDGGLEGYIHDGKGRAVIGMQAKHFVGEKFDSKWWGKMTESVTQALRTNAHHRALERYVICTPRTFNASERKKWESLCGGWTKLATKFGYQTAPQFDHWDYTRLSSIILQPKMRGHLLYWFDHPHFDRNRCVQLNAGSIDQLGERFMPGLHTPTECEDQIHRFLRTERFWRKFSDETASGLAEILEETWPSPSKVPAELKPDVDLCSSRRASLRAHFGDGLRFPERFDQICVDARALADAVSQLFEGYENHLTSLPSDEKAGAPRPERKSPWNQAREDLGEMPSIWSWVEWLQCLGGLPDSQFLLVTGEAGSGKTHTLAEIATEYGRAGGIVLFVEGKRFTSQESPWTQFLRWADFHGRVRDFLACLSALAATTTARAGGQSLPGLICIDALNESDHRKVWLEHLEGFAAELASFPNLRLIVSCRDDLTDLVIPSSISKHSANRWAAIQHEGLGPAVFEAAQKYLTQFKVRGADVLALASEMENPLFLRIFCEAFANSEVPPGSGSLPFILKTYAQRKAENIRDRIGCRDSQVLDALRCLARAIQDTGRRTLPEGQARDLLKTFHSHTDESKSLFRWLCSEGILHDLREEGDTLGETLAVRFAYERVWDYFLASQLLPAGSSTTGQAAGRLRSLLGDPNWTDDHRTLLGLLAIRLPEEGHGELHDFGGFKPRTNDPMDRAFFQSIRWRTRASFTARTEALWDEIRKNYYDLKFFRLSLASLQDHPWNADDLHRRLMLLSLWERDRGWTLALNAEYRDSREASIPSRLIQQGESLAPDLVSDEQARLLGTALAWICSTTGVDYRHRAARALARIVRSRPLVATALVKSFKDVNDPQVWECVLYAAAACAMHSSPSAAGFLELADAVYSLVFSGEAVPPHILIRHYAQTVCERAHAKGALSPDIDPARFRPPFRSEWPQIMSEAEVEALDREDRKFESSPALAAVLSSTRTEQMGGYGYWGRYEMGIEMSRFKQKRISESPGSDDRTNAFDDLIARRFVVGRVLELGLDKSFKDSSDYNNGSRPLFERLGKKYQWIAFHEFLGYLTDHYQYREEQFDPSPYTRSALDFSLPDQLDPVLPETPTESPESEWMIASALPEWVTLLSPFPRILGDAERRQAVSLTTVDDPSPLLRPGGVQGNWIALQGWWEWDEPKPCWIPRGGSSRKTTASLRWMAMSYLVPVILLPKAIEQMSPREILRNSYLEDRPELGAELKVLMEYPNGTHDFDELCETELPGLKGACLAALHYSAPARGDKQIAFYGKIPSPQLGRLASLRWTRHRLDFATPGAANPEFQNFRSGPHKTAAIDATLLTNALKNAGLSLVWRLWGEKLSWGSFSHGEPRRDYWAVYYLDQHGLPQCAGGGTRHCQPWTDDEPLPW
jgi:hypothetical protein